MLLLNVGCGSKPKPGYINIDIQTKAADVHASAVSLPFRHNSVDVIESYHLIEHMDRKDGNEALRHWYNLLKRDGKLVIECPDLEVIIEQYLKIRNEELLYSVYGRNRYAYDIHLWGYTKNSMTNLLRMIGFSKVSTGPGTDYHAKFEPCMRVEAIK